ncbi:DUF1176 domain-containing protein [Oryzicola mucosus]|uniref:DUF1176 domain-containing protein n=1 Tax=Oryzicola mucosus TaxID=2767425 RepID=A0A8J6U3G7_9HYPH|nr:DUF1176 domain-containing protein [Oryzicola mucosus]MBD0416608.1 DUF1176 domain-containing protein [Oryzicola mucosus]
MTPRLTAAATALFAFSCFPGLAAEPDYYDNRSDAASLIKSLYNAIDRKEYARAWDYYGEEKPAKDFQTFQDGYAKTESVDVLTGAVSSEGAAGSIYYNVPVAIRANDSDGSDKVFAGCYVVRQVNGSIQEPPFQPMLIDKGTLKAADGNLADALPAQCGEAPPPETDAVLQKVNAWFSATYAGPCKENDGPGGRSEEQTGPEAHKISYHKEGDDASEPASEARLFRFFCMMGAYNETHIYYLWDEVNDLRQLEFASPELDIQYADPDTNEKVESVKIIGYQADSELVNSDYDEQTMTITSNGKWRGVGDASDSGTWLFRNGEFTLVKYDVDASYDGEINPETVLDYYSAP